MKLIEKQYLKALKELENYCQYMLRCLHRCNIHPKPTEIIYLTFPRDNGTVAEAIVYPVTSIDEKNGEINNPMFFYGFKMDYDFHDLENPIRLTFSTNYEELLK